MRIIVSLALIIGLLASFVPDVSAATPPDGIYKVKLSLMKRYDEEKSMGDGAFVPTGFITVSGGKAKLRIKMIPLTAFNFRGYLSELLVKDQPVNVLSRYDEYDVYNNPTNGKDAKFKGVKYPKEMEFDLEWGEKDIFVQVYVPVMGELASGDQKARLRIDWPSNPESAKVSSINFDSTSVDDTAGNTNDTASNAYQSKDTRNLPPLEKGENISLEPGIYKLDVSLYHEREDKASMGNNAMVHDAELISKDGKYTFLLGSTTMEVSNIIASLVSLQIRDDNAYYHFAEPHAFDLSIPGEQDKRPEVFSFDLVRKDPMIYVKVDPKVKPMGEVPVGARLKIDWLGIKKIEESESVLYKKMKNGTPRKKFDPKEKIHKILPEGFELVAQPGAFKENIVFKVNPVTGGASFQKVTQKFGRGTAMKIYEFKIENDYGIPTKPSKSITIKAKLPSNIVKPKVYRLTDMAEMNTSVSGEYTSFTTDTYGEFAFVASNGSGSSGQLNNGNKSNNNSKALGGTNNNKSSSNNTNSNSKKTSDTKASSNSKATTNTVSATSISDLKNDATDFSTASQPESTDQANQPGNVTKTLKAKENPKVIFYSVLILTAIIAGSAYVYTKFSKRLIYEFKYNSYLKNKINEFNKVREIL
ncbi:NEAT domain-containing protein [uncultured Peptostreptococcus sp.]|uniref:NEAT domain-containing protein n=1 Tax=Peptostreptococcus stomatis TaxID=341694 RepID=UPI002804DF88|nr:NEAT domain-containing protein [uncultured Peptostreptococcus sp.]